MTSESKTMLVDRRASEPVAHQASVKPDALDSQLQRLFEPFCVVVTLLLLTQPFSHVTIRELSFGQICPLVCSVLMGLLVVAHLRFNKLLLRTVAIDILPLLLFYALLSAFWSLSALDSLVRATAFCGTFLFGVYLAARFKVKDQMALLLTALGAAAIGSLAIQLLAPGLCNIGPTGGWVGIYEHKNSFGRVLGMLTLLCLCRAWTRGYSRWITLPMAGLSSVLLILSDAGNATLAAGILAVMLPVIWLLRNRTLNQFAVLATIVLLSGMGLVVLTQEGIVTEAQDFALGVLGRDLDRNTVNVRNSIADEVIIHIKRRPLLGYGLNSFRTLFPSGIRVDTGRQSVLFDTFHAHNGFLHVLLELGVAGLLALLALMVIVLQRGLHCLREIADPVVGLWTLTFTGYLLMISVSYSVVLGYGMLFWITLVALAYSSKLALLSADSSSPDP